MRILLACLTVAAFAGPVAACLNDRELPTHEREFRSNYRGPDRPTEPSSPSPLPVIAGGVALLSAAAAVLYFGRSRG